MPEGASYVSYYGMNEEPFGERVDLRLLYRSVAHERAMQSLVEGIEEGQRLQAVVASPGAGKTMLLHGLAAHFQFSARVVLVFQITIGADDCLKFISNHPNLRSSGTSSGDYRERLASVLEAEKGKGRFLLVAIDEAQHLSARALAELQAWSRSGANADALRIVLGAQPVFRSLLCSKGLESLREGLSVCDLSPLALDEVPAYVNHRLRVCGFSGKSLFTPEAFALLARHSGGIPCVINMVGFRSLSIGFRERAKQIDASIVEKAIGEREAVLSSTTAVAASDLSVMPQESKSTEEPRRPEMARVEHASPVPARLVSWMTPRGITWSGTAGELLAELEREGGSQETTWEVTDPEHLWLTLLVESESLARRGIEVGSQERPGRPRFIVIRKTSGWSGAPAEISDRRGNATENRPYIEDRLASGPIVQPSPANEASPTAAVRDGTVVAKRSSDDPSSDRLVRELAERGASGSPEGAALFQAAMELLSEFDKSDETQRTESDPERLWREIQAEAQSPEPGISDNIDQSSPESSPGTDAANDRVRKIAPKSERSEGRKWFRRRGR